MTAWRPAATELDLYEGIRRGDEDAFRAFAEPLQPTLRRLAGLYSDSEATTDAVVLRTWEVSLRALAMFCWHTPFATWIARTTVAFGRTHDRRTGGTNHRTGGRTSRPTAPGSTGENAGPPDWSDLPWSQRWEHVGAPLTHTLAAMPRVQREVIHGTHIEQWPPLRVCDVFGLPEIVYERHLAAANARLHNVLARHVGQAGPDRHYADQVAAVAGWLAERLDARSERLDPRALAAFRRWSAPRRMTWRRLIHRLKTAIV